MSDRPATVRVRIAVGVSADGAWAAYAWGYARVCGFDHSQATEILGEMLSDEHPLDAIRYVEADVPVPVPQPKTGETIRGEVTQQEETR